MLSGYLPLRFLPGKPLPCSPNLGKEIPPMKRSLHLTLLLVLLASPAFAQQKNESQATQSPLVRLLQSKGVITEQEAAQITEASSPAESERRLAKLLLAKGIINQQEYNQTESALGAGS